MIGKSIGLDDLLKVIQAEYRESPALNLTKPQMQRLWAVDGPVCNALVDALVNARVLRQTPNGTYVLHESRR